MNVQSYGFKTFLCIFVVRGSCSCEGQPNQCNHINAQWNTCGASLFTCMCNILCFLFCRFLYQKKKRRCKRLYKKTEQTAHWPLLHRLQALPAGPLSTSLRTQPWLDRAQHLLPPMHRVHWTGAVDDAAGGAKGGRRKMNQSVGMCNSMPNTCTLYISRASRVRHDCGARRARAMV